MNTPTPADLKELVNREFDQMVDIRRAIHRHPEIGFAETATTSLIADRANTIGLEPLFCPTETGSVWSLEGGQPGQTVLIRADIDALPIIEEADEEFASEVHGVMHACGHDAHTAQLLGAASALASRAEDLPGRYIFLFQPAEEALGGAKAMVDGGVLDRLDVAAVIGCHVASIAPTGLVGVRTGITMADVRTLRIDVHGIGGHGAAYTAGANPLLAAAVLSTRLEGIVEGMELEGTACACTAGVLQAGTASNVIPSHAHLEGTLRTFTPAQTDAALAGLEALLGELAEETGCTFSASFGDHSAAVVNDERITDVVRTAATEALGASAVFEMPPVSPSEDFSEFLNRIPGSFFFVGAGRADGTSGMHHNPSFAIDEACMPIGATVLAAAAVRAATPLTSAT